MTHTLHLGDNLATLKNYPDNTFDSIVTDPPYGIDFLGKEWDSHTGTVELYKECLRVLKPGGYLLAFSAARTYHKLAYSVELAGFEIRDQLMWLYSSGFPKAQDIGKAIQKRLGVKEKWVDNGGSGINLSIKEQSATTICTDDIAKEWEGFKSALKPAHEPIVMARKPFKGSTIDNVLKNGLGAMNIDATRVPWADEKDADDYKERTAEDRWATGVGYEACFNELGAMERELQRPLKGTQKRKKSDRESAGGFSGLNTVCTSPLAKEWEGWKTSLKPAHEPIVMARKPFKGSTIDNVLKNGLGAMNIDATRVPWADEKDEENHIINIYENGDNLSMNMETGDSAKGTYKKKKSDKPQAGSRTKTFGTDIGSSGVSGGDKDEPWEACSGRYPSNVIGEVVEGYQKYFYCPKVSRKERHVGFDIGDQRICSEDDQTRGTQADHATKPQIGNNHPTVKPVALMDYLIKLVTPPSTPTLQRKVLDPFMGSGSTGMAATALGHHFTGCELDPKYVAIAETRIEAWNDSGLPKDLFE